MIDYDDFGERGKETLRKQGIHLERKADATASHSVIGVLLGSLAGRALAQGARMGPLGAAIGLFGGAFLGHVAATHKVYYKRPEEDEGPESPAVHSDRR